MGSLLRDVISARAIRIIPPASEGLAKDGIQGLLNATTENQSANNFFHGYVGVHTEA